jgi:hypothetical protein
MRLLTTAVLLVLPAFGCDELPPSSHNDVRCPEGSHAHVVTYGSDPREDETMWCVRSDGVRHGPHASWFRDGNLSRQGRYDDGVRVGRWTYYHPNGQPKVEGEYAREAGTPIEGKMFGPWIGRDEQGEKSWVQIFRKPGVYDRATRYERGGPVECFVGFTREPCQQ